MNPSPDFRNAIHDRVADWGLSDAAIVDLVNAPAVPNPRRQDIVAKPYTVSDVFGALKPATVTSLRSFPGVGDFISKIQANDGPGVLGWLDFLQIPPAVVDDDERAAVVAVLRGTRPDPSWQSRVGWPEAEFGRPADIFDVIDARPEPEPE